MAMKMSVSFNCTFVMLEITNTHLSFQLHEQLLSSITKVLNMYTWSFGYKQSSRYKVQDHAFGSLSKQQILVHGIYIIDNCQDGFSDYSLIYIRHEYSSYLIMDMQ